VSYLEGCTAPMRDENQLHAAVVELVALDDAEIKYSTVQNWYPGRRDGKGGIYNFVTKRGVPRRALARSPGRRSRPARRSPGSTRACILRGDDSVRRVLLGGGDQQPPAGRHRHQDDPPGQAHTPSTIVSKGISAGHGTTPTAAWCAITPKAEGARNYTQCDSLLIGDRLRRPHRSLHRGPQPDRQVEHEATTSKHRRGPALLLPAARHQRGGRGVADRQRLLPRRCSRNCRWSSPWRRRSCWQHVRLCAPP
jgi:Fe-S cluster assembly protein SufB